jgi:hypothetical protein
VTRFFPEVMTVTDEHADDDWRATDLAAEYALEAFFDDVSDDEIRRRTRKRVDHDGVV